MSDDEGFGDLFGGVEEVPEYPLQTLSIRRQDLAAEGRTYDSFTPLLDRFDHITSASTVAEEERALRERLVRLDPPPLDVRFRDKRHSLWGHKLWNAAKYLVKRMDERMIDVRGKSVIELGAGLGVPTLAAYKNGARLCVVTDYPDADLLDIIALNVEANCTPGDIDADVKEELMEQARQQLSAKCAAESSSGSGSGSGSSNTDSTASTAPPSQNTPAAAAAAGEKPTEEELTRATRTRCYVEPLLWGKKEHIDKVLAYTTGGAGYDVVILSDILFNHVCNSDLADTLAMLLAKNARAAGYCVFSHHRAYKQLHDFEFFDKCVRRGLQYEQVDEQDYPMMFPEDRGPESVRQPVKCYKITRRYDAAGCGLDVGLRFDVVLQGTGLVQAILSAALSRNGLKVLHCDGDDHYAAAMSTFEHTGFLAHLQQLATKAGGSPADVFMDRMADDVPAERRRRYLFDVLPMCYMARGPLLRRLIKSGMGSSLECQHVHRLLLLQHSTSARTAAPTTTAMEVPLTRAGVFGSTAVGLFDKRRMMRFVKDVEASVAEQLHAKTANPADDPSVANTSAAAEAAAAEAAAIFAREAATHPGATLTGVLQQKYAVTGTALDVVSLMGMMDVLPATPSSTLAGSGTGAGAPLVQSVDMVRDLLLSTGAFEGRSPFLATSYGAAEVAQNMCRVSAVWGGVFVLRRSLRGVTVDEEKETQYAVLSNGQWVPARVIVTPAELLPNEYLRFSVQDWYYDLLMEREQGRAPLLAEVSEPTTTSSSPAPAAVEESRSESAAVVRFSRVVLATTTSSLFSLSALQAAGVIEVDAVRDYADAAPIITALAREPQTQAVVWVVQQSFASDQAPPRYHEDKNEADSDPCVLHFTADAGKLSQEALREYVMRTYTTETAGAAYTVCRDDLVLAVAFTLDGRAVAQQGVVPEPVEVPSETRWTHPFGWSESTKLRRATEHDRAHLLHATAQTDAEETGEGSAAAAAAVAGPSATTPAAQRAADLCRGSEHFRLVQVPTLLPNLVYDGHYLQQAEAAYAEVLRGLGISRDTAAPEADDDAYAFLRPLPPQQQPH